MLGIEGIGFVHAAGQNWQSLKHAMENPQAFLGTKTDSSQTVEGFFVPSLPQPQVPNGRRFSPWLKMVLAAGQAAVQQSAGFLAEKTLGIIGATTMGSLQHTAAFVENMIRNQEVGPQPANFILSVHNAATAQLAIALQATGYSNTVSHDETAFEQALMIAQMQMAHAPASRFVVFGAEEWIPLLHHARLASGCWHSDALPLSGEGAVAMVVGKSEPGQVRLKCLRSRCFISPARDVKKQIDWIQESLTMSDMDWHHIDLIMTLDDSQELWDQMPAAKHISQMVCRPWLGNFGMANAFVIGAAVAMLQNKENRPVAAPENLKHILIYNQTDSGNTSIVVVGR